MGINRESNKPLLEDSDQNIGNSIVLNPEAGTNGTIIPQLNNPRLVNLSAGSSRGQTTTITVTASRIIKSQQNPYPGLAGPITGIAEFGNGGRFTRVEFDVPIGPFVGTWFSANSSIEPQDGGTIITVPTGVLRVYLRYDNLLVASPINPIAALPPRTLAQIAGVPLVGPGGPIGNTPAEPVLGKAMSAYFSRHFSKAYKTTTCYVSQVIPTPIFVPVTYYCLPPFAKTVKILRLPMSSALDVSLATSTQPTVDVVAIAGGANSPDINVEGQVSIVGINSHGPGDTVTYLAFVCEVGV